MPALPKHPSTRARRNKVAGARTLQVVHDLEVPELPDEAGVDWHPMTASWWDDIWASPMAPEFDESDIHGLYLLASLVDAFWCEPSQALAAEIRLQRQCFGLTPIDRRRLQWEIDRGEEAEQAIAQRRNRSQVSTVDDVDIPAASDSKAKWVEFAVSQGMPAATARKMTKPALAAKFASVDGDVRTLLTS
jgi:hypothetical protein